MAKLCIYGLIGMLSIFVIYLTWHLKIKQDFMNIHDTLTWCCLGPQPAEADSNTDSRWTPGHSCQVQTPGCGYWSVYAGRPEGWSGQRPYASVETTDRGLSGWDTGRWCPRTHRMLLTDRRVKWRGDSPALLQVRITDESYNLYFSKFKNINL